jgi:uncharacterized membrane protein YeiH
MTLFSDVNFTILLDMFGTFAFAVSGIKLASGKNIDWFGAYIIGLITAIGGGTIRDLLLDVRPFWMEDARYLITTGVALVASILFKEKLFKWGNTLFLFDTIGLGLFTIVGISKSLDAGLPVWVCVIMGTITGSLGGVLRDVLINEVPLLFRKDIYALACVVGGIVYFVCYNLQFQSQLTAILSALTVIIIRIVTVKFHIQLPILSTLNDESNED